MSNSDYQTFLVFGLMILVVGVLTVAWLLWRRHELYCDGVKRTIEGVSHEASTNIQRALAELGSLARGEPGKTSMLMPAKYPMIDLLNSKPFDIDRQATNRLSHYISLLEAARLDLRSTLARGGDSQVALHDAMEAGLEAIIGLYLWENQKGVAPDEAPSTRSRAVRQWMKDRKFDVDVYPEKNLRDEIVFRLRDQGMTLTPKPLNMTASEYWSRRYDRHADPRGPFGRRKTLQPQLEDAEVVEDKMLEVEWRPSDEPQTA